MDFHAITEKLKKTEKQRNLAFVGMGLSVIGLVAVSVLAASKQDTTILVPTTVSPFHITAGRVPNDYLIAVTRDAASLMLNRHPHDTNYFKENMLRLVDPRIHDAMSARMDEDEAANRFKAGRRNWMPIEICRLPGEAFTTEVVGDLETYVNGVRVSNEKIVKRFVWSLSGTRLFLSDVIDVEFGRHECARIKDEGEG